MHGGAPGSGAPLGNKNAFKTGAHTGEVKAQRQKVRSLLRSSRDLIKQVNKRQLQNIKSFD
jgi:hypothetical protein